MMDGFDLDSPLICEGIVGDGCGGGRLFFVKNEILVAYDPETKESITLLKNVLNAIKITKNFCIITIECNDETITFDLSSLSRV